VLPVNAQDYVVGASPIFVGEIVRLLQFASRADTENLNLRVRCGIAKVRSSAVTANFDSRRRPLGLERAKFGKIPGRRVDFERVDLPNVSGNQIVAIGRDFHAGRRTGNGEHF
jgi:hypothetical protein